MTSTIPDDITDKAPTMDAVGAAAYCVTELGFPEMTRAYIVRATRTGQLAYRIFMGERRYSKHDIRAWLIGESE